MPRFLEYIEEQRRQGVDLQFMQDNAPGHAAKATIAWLAARGIVPIKWPARSPDLNPIEHIWSWMKMYLQEQYGDRKFSAKELREKVEEAWHAAVTPEKLRHLIESMPRCCQAVIDARGGYTSYRGLSGSGKRQWQAARGVVWRVLYPEIYTSRA